MSASSIWNYENELVFLLQGNYISFKHAKVCIKIRIYMYICLIMCFYANLLLLLLAFKPKWNCWVVGEFECIIRKLQIPVLRFLCVDICICHTSVLWHSRRLKCYESPRYKNFAILLFATELKINKSGWCSRVCYLTGIQIVI